MFLVVTGLQNWILLALQVACLAGAGFAFVHALRQRPDAFPAVDKLTKPAWLAILGGALVFLLISSPVGILGLIGVIAVGIYLVDVRPRVDDIQRGPRW